MLHYFIATHTDDGSLRVERLTRYPGLVVLEKFLHKTIRAVDLRSTALR